MAAKKELCLIEGACIFLGLAIGKATAGAKGCLSLSWWDSKNGWYRTVVLDDNGGFVQARG